uniref:Small ribosomal subunit protein bS16m n=1 Tax=Brugia timori TaxID=42155 RepID=A0A0R3QWQ1_9BILA
LKYSAGRPSIGLALFGCKNRPAYRIVVFPDKAYGRHYEGSIIEELGVFDPLPNFRNEKLVACDITRVKYWIGERNAHISPSLLELLGLWGVLPIHPKTFIRARYHLEELEEAKLKVHSSTSQSGSPEVESKKETEKKENHLPPFYIWSMFFVDYACAECQEEVKILPRSSHEFRIVRSLYIFENDTKKCDEAEFLLVPSRAPFCDSHDLSVTFSSVAVLPNGTNMLPYILLNVSIWVNNPVSSVFLRLECLGAPNMEDDYCHNHEEQSRRWGRMIWPCRSLTLSEPDLVSYPYFFNYHCFRLTSYSHYRLNVSYAPNACRKSFIVTIPEEAQMNPAISRFYDKDAASGGNYWSPLASVDLTLRDRVVIRYEKQPALAATPISIAVFETIASSSTHLFTNTLDAGVVEYAWKNVPAGNFTVYLYVSRLDCDLICNSDTVDKCTLCPSTRIYFTVEEDKIWFSASVHGLLSHGTCVVGASMLCFVVTIGFLFFFLAIKCFHKVPLREVLLSHRTTVFIAYVDDCKPHSDCIAVLAKVLQHSANVDVFMDQFELKYSETLPLRWFVNKFAVANHVVLIFSEGASVILHGESLIQRQPFPEFFSVALNMLIAEYSKDVTKQSGKLLSEIRPRFAFAYMTYSPSSVIPEELTTLPINIFKLPEQVQNLISWLHNQPSDIYVDVCVDISDLKSAVNEVVEYRRKNAIWLTERLQDKHKNFGSAFALQNVPFQSNRSVLTPEEQINIAEVLNLEPPDIHSSIEEIRSKEDDVFALIGSPSDSSFDSDDSTSNRKHLQ